MKKKIAIDVNACVHEDLHIDLNYVKWKRRLVIIQMKKTSES